VIVPSLNVEPVLVVTLIVILPSPVPLVGDTDNHDGALLIALQAPVEVTDITSSCVTAVGYHQDVPTVGVGAACVTVIVLDMPPLITVIAPLLEAALVLAKVVRVILPSPIPLAGDTVSQ